MPRPRNPGTVRTPMWPRPPGQLTDPAAATARPSRYPATSPSSERDRMPASSASAGSHALVSSARPAWSIDPRVTSAAGGAARRSAYMSLAGPKTSSGGPRIRATFSRSVSDRSRRPPKSPSTAGCRCPGIDTIVSPSIVTMPTHPAGAIPLPCGRPTTTQLPCSGVSSPASPRQVLDTRATAAWLRAGWASPRALTVAGLRCVERYPHGR